MISLWVTGSVHQSCVCESASNLTEGPKTQLICNQPTSACCVRLRASCSTGSSWWILVCAHCMFLLIRGSPSPRHVHADAPHTGWSNNHHGLCKTSISFRPRQHARNPHEWHLKWHVRSHFAGLENPITVNICVQIACTMQKITCWKSRWDTSFLHNCHTCNERKHKLFP